MPAMDGYEVCRRIKSQPATEDIPVIFVSGLDDIDERLGGYEAGADDFIVKPFLPDDLRKKVALAVANHDKLISLKQDSSIATQAAMQAMTTSGEFGVVLNFYRNSFACNDYDELAEALLDATNNYGVNCAVQFRLGKGVQKNYDSSGVVRPLESSLLEKLRDKARIFDFGARTVVNFPKVSVLVKTCRKTMKSSTGGIKTALFSWWKALMPGSTLWLPVMR